MLEERLSKDNGKGWDILENLARQCVLAGGVSAIKYYEGAVALAEGANPSTMADHDATFSLIRSLENELNNLSSNYNFDYRYFGEEFEKLETGKASDSEKKAIEDVIKRLSYVSDKISKKYSDLKEERQKRLERRGNQPIQISTQITRSNEEKRKEGLEMLEKMPSKSTVYMLNGGQYSMSQVARGSLDYYINNWTYSWDVSPGEVLINAIGGKVTDISKKPIDYTKKRIGVISAGDERAYNELSFC